MKRCHWGLVVSLSAVLLFILGGTNGRADTKDNPFAAIADRNVFGLKPPPPPPDPSTNLPAPVAAPPATVELTGITSILNNTKALLEIVPGPGKPLVKPPPMSVGERVESVELLAINMEKNEVTIRNGNLTTNLTFKVVKSDAKAVAGVPGPGIPGAPQPGVPLHQAAPQPGFSQYPNSRNNVMVAGGAPAVPATPNFAQPNAAAANPSAAGGVGADGMRSIPSRNIRTTAPQAQPTVEEHYILTELNRNTHGLPLPPTPLNPSPQYPNRGNPQGTPNTPQFPNFPPIPGGGNPQQ